ncbi:CGNR zinc finger domain-containing protein [Miniimonas sp. S16]|uniref:CGNR zinc finger domain-containing protein n=1 Tax=Miniimonas sp. S16 TaxID=2171623 RepID=UPI000D529FAE|nr:CGNR zinc finger domain-containing protein [Miniimonas sp. S16]
MLFSPDTTSALVAALALVNTARMRDGVDRMASVAALESFYASHGYSGRRDGDEAEVAAVRAVRDRIAPLWDVCRDEAVALVNAMLADGDATPRLMRHDSWDWHLHAVPMDAPLDVQMLVETGMAMVDVIRSGAFDRLRRCEGADCAAVLVDLSRNSSRRFCDVNNCANRAHVEAYRARRAAELLRRAAESARS